jgi:hypothetical protein
MTRNQAVAAMLARIDVMNLGAETVTYFRKSVAQHVLHLLG